MDGDMSEDNVELDRVILPELIPVVRNPDRRIVIGKFGSLVETMGDEEADKFLNVHSLTRRARESTARRRGRPVIRGQGIMYEHEN